MHRIIISRAMLTYRSAPHPRKTIEESFGFSKLGFRLQSTVPHSFFREFGCLTLEGQRCLAEMLEFQFQKEKCSQLELLTQPGGLEDGFLVTRKEIGHVLVYCFDAPWFT